MEERDTEKQRRKEPGISSREKRERTKAREWEFSVAVREGVTVPCRPQQSLLLAW